MIRPILFYFEFYDFFFLIILIAILIEEISLNNKELGKKWYIYDSIITNLFIKFKWTYS